MERLLTATFDARPIVLQDGAPEEFWQASGKEFVETPPPRLLSAATFEEVEETPDACPSPADALHSHLKAPIPAPRTETKALTAREKKDLELVREVIEEEMPETSAEERDIWFEELKTLPAEVVRDLLQVRKQMRVLTPEHSFSGPGQLSQGTLESLPAEREIAAEPVMRSQPLSTRDWFSTRDAFEQAIAWSTHNLANASTPGYKRWRVMLGDAYALDEQSGEHSVLPLEQITGQGCRIASLSLDLEQGNIADTGRELDLAIDGPGFFVVFHEPSNKTYLTRNGAFRLTADRRLARHIDGEDFLVDRTLQIPAAATNLQINQDGSVQVIMPEKEGPQTIGQIQLAAMLLPINLVAHGNGMLVDRGNPDYPLDQPGRNGLGVLRQGALEQSNVDLEQEQQERDDLQQLLKLLPSPGLPRTARESDRTPH